MIRRVAKRVLSYELKQNVRERDDFRCTVKDCQSHTEATPELNIHHVLPEKYGGTDDPSNLVTLCLSHHKMMHMDFHAYYPDSLRAVKRMWYHLRRVTSIVESKLKFGEYYDYKAPLEYLTGHRRFRGGQDEVFRAVMDGRDVLFVAPTGVGKSVTYQLPGLIYKNPTLVVSPLKSLMKNQVEGLWNHYVPSTYINGDLGVREIEKRIQFIAQGMMKFVYVAPERYFKSPKSKPVFNSKYDLLVIDEAHCIDKWGGHFRQDYGELALMRAGLGNPQTIAVTASASVKTQDEIVRSLGLKNPVKIVKGFYRPNIAITVRRGDKKELLYRVLQEYAQHDGKTIFYVGSVREGEKLRDILSQYGCDVGFYHGKLDPETKSIIQNRFTGIRSNDETNMVIATSAFGMGIDISNIRTVIHWNIPATIEDYYQQIGRAGRDGELADAILLYQGGDEGLPNYINEMSVDANKNLTADERDTMKERLKTELIEMVGIVDSPAPWGYILGYFGDQGILSRSQTWWQRIMVMIKSIIK